MTLRLRFVPALFLVAATPATPPPAPTPPRGFLPASVAAEEKVEREFRALPDPAVARETMRRLSAFPHNLGSPEGAKNAEWILARFQEWGLDAHIETFDVLFPTPKERIVELVEPVKFRAALAETPLKEDPTSGQTAQQLPTFNAYSTDGDVTAPLVYVNYGVPDDYEVLERLGIDVRGKIVIARYGGGWRGIKPKVAAEHGAVGCIIYSDPRDDGYFQGEVYPKGAWRPEQGVQRGSVADMPTYSGRPADAGRRRRRRRQAPRPQGRADHHEDPGAADLVRRRAAAARRARGPGRARALARRAADHVPHRTGTREGPPEARLRLEARARARRHREDPGLRLARRVGHPRQPPRRVGQRRGGSDQRALGRSSRKPARWARSSSAAGARSARSSSARGTARRKGCSARPSGPRRTPPSSGPRPWRTSTPTATAAGS